MDRIISVNLLPGLLAFLLLQGVLTVQARSILSPGNHVFHQKDDTDIQNKIIALLLHKSLAPVERNDAIGFELANKIVELEELEALKQDLELERELASNTEMSMPRKRGEACFWKYCV